MIRLVAAMIKSFSGSLFAALLFAASLGAASLDAAEKPNIILVFADDIATRVAALRFVRMESTHGRQHIGCCFAGTDSGTRSDGCGWLLGRDGLGIGRLFAQPRDDDDRPLRSFAQVVEQQRQRPVSRCERQSRYLAVVREFASFDWTCGTASWLRDFLAGKTQMAGDLREFGFDQGCFTPGELADTDNPFTDFKMYEKKVDGKKQLFKSDTDQPIDSYLQHGWYWNPHVRLMKHAGKLNGFQWWPNTPESEASFGLNTYGPDVELDFIFDFMDRQQADGKPFFVYHTSHLGHDAFDWLNPDSTSKWPGTPVVKWDGKGYTRTAPHVTGDKGVYDTHGTVTDPGIHNHVHYLDYQIWLYRNKLQEMGIADNTVLIFCADNGTSGYGKNSSDRQKGTHVPLIILAPGMTKQGRQDVLVNMADMLPTIADLTGAMVLSDYEVNGESLVPFLFTDQPKHRDWIYGYNGAGPNHPWRSSFERRQGKMVGCLSRA